MEEVRFESLNELYNRLYPAFNTKKNELKNLGVSVKELQIWNYLKDRVWKKAKNLQIYDMVNDIMNLDVDGLLKYIKGDK